MHWNIFIFGVFVAVHGNPRYSKHSQQEWDYPRPDNLEPHREPHRDYLEEEESSWRNKPSPLETEIDNALDDYDNKRLTELVNSVGKDLGRCSEQASCHEIVSSDNENTCDDNKENDGGNCDDVKEEERDPCSDTCRQGLRCGCGGRGSPDLRCGCGGRGSPDLRCGCGGRGSPDLRCGCGGRGSPDLRCGCGGRGSPDLRCGCGGRGSPALRCGCGSRGSRGCGKRGNKKKQGCGCRSGDNPEDLEDFLRYGKKYRSRHRNIHSHEDSNEGSYEDLTRNSFRLYDTVITEPNDVAVVLRALFERCKSAKCIINELGADDLEIDISDRNSYGDDGKVLVRMQNLLSYLSIVRDSESRTSKDAKDYKKPKSLFPKTVYQAKRLKQKAENDKEKN